MGYTIEATREAAIDPAAVWALYMGAAVQLVVAPASTVRSFRHRTGSMQGPSLGRR
jgi:hypothetical protein